MSIPRPFSRPVLRSASLCCLFGLLCVFYGSSLSPFSFGQSQETEKKGARIESDVDEGESGHPTIPPENRDQNTANVGKTGKGEEIVRTEFQCLIPNQKVLYLNEIPPPTRIDLNKFFDVQEKFQHVVPIITIVGKGKKDVVEPTLDHGVLTLNWIGLGSCELILKITNPETGYTLHNRTALEVWRPDYWSMILTVVGSLGIFLLGMKYMSEGLQTIAGSGLRRLIATVTNNRFLAVGVGFLVTAIIQSSSVTTVMVVSFVNSQIMTLSQAIGVIMGANIGTTITAWILVLSIGKYGLPILGVAGFFYLFSKNDRLRFVAMSIMGLGMVFFGLDMMQKGFSVLRELPSFIAWMDTFSANDYFGVLKCVAVGCILTLIVQSSSATLGITISLAAIGVIRFDTAGALVLGENIGTTITAFLASLGTNANARRAAYFHIIFNTFGVFWITLCFFPLLIPAVKAIVGVNEAGEIANVKQGIAWVHTLFNLTNTILFLPFVGMFSNILTQLVRDRQGKGSKPRITGLQVRLFETAAISIERSRIEVLRMSSGCLDLAANVKAVAESDEENGLLIEQAFRQEETLDILQDEIIEYTADLLSGNISHDVAEIARDQLKMADELESISDYLIAILKSNLKLRNAGLSLPEPIKSQIGEVHTRVVALMQLIHDAYVGRRDGVDLLTETHVQGRSITVRIKAIRDQFLKQMSEEKYDPQVIMAVNTQLNAYRRVREHTQNAAEATAGVK
ncbi:MAG: Na/Pi cotransporter family protein [Thermoguttaceae bacterium]